MPSLLLGDDVFEIWVVEFVGFDAVGAECVDGYPFVRVIAITEGLGWDLFENFSGAGAMEDEENNQTHLKYFTNVKFRSSLKSELSRLFVSPNCYNKVLAVRTC